MDERLGPYRIDAELGRGGMGVVYLAHDERLDRLVAIKALPESVAEDAQQLARFRHEARMIAQLNHQHIAQIHHLLEHEDRTYLVLEYIAGQTLASRLRESSIDTSDALRLCAQVARALEAAHLKGVVHRDLKPGNIMVTREGTAKVLDFGLAVSTRSVEVKGDATTIVGGVTRPDRIIGTPGYMPPEQARGELVDHRADLFGLGCVLYECLAGRVAFGGTSTADVITATLREEVDLALLPASVDESVRELVRRCLSKSVEKRQQSAGDARLILEEAMGVKTSRASGSPEAIDIPNNLPRQRTSFVGREREAADIERLLSSAALVTLTGSGGCGKTRLALQVAERLLPMMPDGCWFVDLAPVADPAMVERACAEALGIGEQPGAPIGQSILTTLSDRSLLLVVDNCEHVLDAASRLLDAVLSGASRVRVIATSRESLSLHGERAYRVPSLLLPEADTSEVSSLLACEAVRLFC